MFCKKNNTRKKKGGNMGYLTAKQFSLKWGITERRIIKLCQEERISGAMKNGRIWEIPEETPKPADKRSNIYQYIHTKKIIMIVNATKQMESYLQELLQKEGYLLDCQQVNSIMSKPNQLAQYYEGLIYFSKDTIEKEEEAFIKEFSKKLHAQSSIVIIDYDDSKRNKIEKKLAEPLRKEIGLRINALVLDLPKNEKMIIDEKEIAQDIVELLTKFKNTTGMAITTDAGKIEFDKKGRTKDLPIGEFYRVINQYFKNLNKDSYLWCASTMLEDEWTEEPQEMKFRQINLEVANNGVKVERIFIFSRDRIKDFKKNKTLKIYKQSNIKTLFVDYDEIKKKELKLLEIVADGWDGIDKTTLIADLPENSDKRGFVSINTKEVTRAYECFQKLKTYAKDLKEVLQ